MSLRSSRSREELKEPLLVSINDDDPHAFIVPDTPANLLSPPYTPATTFNQPPASLSTHSTTPPHLPEAPAFQRQISEKTGKRLAQAGWTRQLPAMLHKQALLKWRYPVSFVMELVSPVIVLCILVMGWVLSREGIQRVDSFVYANDTQVLNSWLNDITIVPVSKLPNNTACYTTKNLPPSTAFCFTGDTYQLLNDILGYDGPTSIPTIDEYIGLHRAFVLATANSSSPADSIATLDSLTDHLLTNIIYLGTLAFTPNTTAVHALIQHLNATHQLFRSLHVRVFNTEDEAMSEVLEVSDRYWAVVSFNVLDMAGGAVDYVIRMNYTALPSTSTIISKFQLGLDESFKRYYFSGFLTIQNMIDEAVLIASAHNDYDPYPPYPPRPALFYNTTSSPLLPSSMHTLPPNNSQFISTINLTTTPMPTSAYQGSNFYSNIGPVISLCLAMCMLFPVSRLIKGIVEEKESRTKETMKMMGLLDSVFISSWFISSMLQFTLIAVCITILMHFTLFPHTTFSLLFFYFWLFILSEITFSFLITVFFSSAKVAGIVGPLIIFACVMPRYAFFNTDENEAIAGKTLVSFFSPTAFTLGCDLLISYEGVNLGLTWSGVGDDAFSLLRVMAFLFVDACVYGWLAWYLEHVLPNEYGARQPLWFCLKPSFWFGNWMSEPNHTPEADGQTDDDYAAEYVEPVPAVMAAQASVVIQRLRKQFVEGRGRHKRETVAVSSLDLTFYEGQITALLGHNGAGKTTTISMLTGLIAPTSGDCLMYGLSIVEDMHLIRKSMGVCSQQDVLFDRLSVHEHLTLYANLKGVPKDELESEVSRYEEQIGLTEKRHTFASALSGGQKRKLCVALALIGGSRIVFLDEPTSGMDPFSRRNLWEILRLNKEGRVIIFTTHYMDEADILGDRIAIMSEGNLRCCGSSLFLKSKFGIGYNVTMTRAAQKWSQHDISRSILKYIPDARLLSAAGGELSYRLPLTSVRAFPALFKSIDRKKRSLGIGSYGISMTTLEEVFMRISSHREEEDAAGEAVDDTAKDGQENKDPADNTPTKRKPCSSAFLIADTIHEETNTEILNRTRQSVATRTQLYELFRKRWICALRDLSGKFYETILPVLVVALVLLILKLNVNPAGPEIVLDSTLYTQVQQTDASVYNGQKDATQTSHYVYSASMQKAENATFYFMSHRPAIFMRYTPYSTSLDISQFDLLPSIKSHTGSRYGCFVLNDTVYTRFNWTSGGVAKDPVAIPTPLTLLHNATYIHALPVLATELQAARFAANRYMNGLRGWNDTDHGVVYRVRNHPFPLTARENILIQTYLTLFAALFVMVPFCYLPASFVLFVVRERTVKSKHLQLVSGVNANLYWLATYLWDALNYLFVCVAVMIVILGYGNSEFVGTVENFSATFLLLLLYGLACTPLSYCYSFLFDNYTSAQVGIVGLHFLTGFGLVVTNFMLDNIGNASNANKTFKLLYRLFPPFNLGEGLIQLATRNFTYLTSGVRPGPFNWDIVGRSLTCLAVEAVVYMCLTLVLEHGLVAIMVSRLQRRQRMEDRAEDVAERTKLREQEDEDVAAERRRVEEGIESGSNSEGPRPYINSPPSGAGSPTHRRRASSASPPVHRRSLGTPASPPTGFRSVSPQVFLSVPGEEEGEDGPRRKFSTDSVDSVSSSIVELDNNVVLGADIIRMQRLRKVYPPRASAPPTVAVTDLSLGIQRGTCFGFLGMNGAGKSTTMKMLTGDELPTSGTASINGYDVITQTSFIQKERGFCPQSDPLLDMLTGREQLTLFARLRGIPGRFVGEVVWSLLDRLGLGKICDRRCGSYSGGNKRKLSLAIAMVGDPSVLFLDEPSTGMDPVSRRFMWSVISAVADSRSVILTSHSMEEVEALCNAIGIMVAGRLRCLGSIQHLKHRFSDMYHLDLNTRETHTERVKRYVEQTFPQCVLEEEHAVRLKYGLPRTNLRLGDAFGSIERVKDELGIVDYSLSQSSLEQIFLATVRKAEEEQHSQMQAEGGSHN